MTIGIQDAVVVGANVRLCLALSRLKDTYVLGGLAVLPLLVSESHVASSLGSGALLFLECLAGGTRADGGVLVEAVVEPKSIRDAECRFKAAYRIVCDA